MSVMDTKENQLLQFGLCLNNEGYPASLEVGKAYRVIPDDEATVHGYIRVIDESGEDYAYTANRFHLSNCLSLRKGIVVCFTDYELLLKHIARFRLQTVSRENSI